MTDDLEERIETTEIPKPTLKDRAEGAYMLGSLAYHQARSIVKSKYQTQKKRFIKKRDELLTRRNYR